MMMTMIDNIQMIQGTIHCLKLSPNLRRSLEEETNLEEKDEKLDVSNEENHFFEIFKVFHTKVTKKVLTGKKDRDQQDEDSALTGFVRGMKTFCPRNLLLHPEN